MRRMIFEMITAEPVVIVGVSLLVALVSVAACYMPARRASRMDPIETLRHE